MIGLSSGSAALLQLYGDQGPEARARSAASTLQGAREGIDREELKFAAQEMESFFLYQLLQVMRRTIQKSGIFGDRKKEETYIGMMDMELSKLLAKAGGIGIAPMIIANIESGLPSAKKTTPKENAAGRMGPGTPLPGDKGLEGLPPAEPLRDGASRKNLREGISRKKGFFPLKKKEFFLLKGSPAGRKGPGRPLPGDKSLEGLPAVEPLREGASREREFFWTRPIEGKPSSRFGYRKDPFGGGRSFHSGVDIAAPEGKAVRAARPGKVTFAGRNGGYGNLVEILHPDNTITRYAHNSALLVRQGDVVVSGQEIAQVGATGRSTGPHLHFELLREGRRVDPMEILIRSRI